MPMPPARPVQSASPEGLCRSCGSENMMPDGTGNLICLDCGDMEEGYADYQQQHVARGAAKRRYRLNHGLPTDY